MRRAHRRSSLSRGNAYRSRAEPRNPAAVYPAGTLSVSRIARLGLIVHAPDTVMVLLERYARLARATAFRR